jgi:hypothetical protein
MKCGDRKLDRKLGGIVRGAAWRAIGTRQQGDEVMTSALIGKYFLGQHGFYGTGIVEAVIDDSHYLVRFLSTAVNAECRNASPL